MTKKELRKIFTAKREALSDADYLELNKKICQRFFETIDLNNVRMVHSFLPMIRRREVDSMMIIEKIRAEFKHLQIAVPRISTDGVSLENFLYEGPEQLMINSWGIKEPKYGELVDSKQIDLVLVPLLAFDKQGNRVGYGKGFYDRFLSGCRKDCQKIGLSMFEPVDFLEQNEVWDVRLDTVINPDRSLTFNNGA